MEWLYVILAGLLGCGLVVYEQKRRTRRTKRLDLMLECTIQLRTQLEEVAAKMKRIADSNQEIEILGDKSAVITGRIIAYGDDDLFFLPEDDS